MSFLNCIANSHQQGLITLEQRQQYQKRFEALRKLVPTSQEAKDQLIKELEFEALEKERRAVLAEKSRKDMVGFIVRYRNRQGQQDLAEGLRVYVEKLEPLQKAVLGRWTRGLDEFFEEFKKGALTGDLRRMGGKLSNTEVMTNLEDTVRELFGENSKNPLAKALAQAWQGAAETARLEFNALGGSIQKLEKWGLPQVHQPDKLYAYGRQKWINYMMGKDVLDRERTVSPITGKRMSDDDMIESLGVIWDRITSDGFHDMDPSMTVTGKGALYKQHQDHRFLHFKNADAWMKYAREFGNPDFYASMVSHLEMMARDVTAMQALGPNPIALMNYGKQFVQKHVMAARTINANRTEQMAEIARLSLERHELTKQFTGNAGEAAYKTIQSLHGILRTTLDEMDALRAKGDLQTNADAREKMNLLQQDIDRINAELHQARNDPSYGLGQALPLGKMIELTAINRRYLQLLDEVRLDAVEVDARMRSAAGRALTEADKIWDLYRGTTNAVHDYRLSNTMTMLRNLNAASKLGGAMISALSDITFQKLTRSFLGMKKSGFTDIIKGTTENFSQLSKAEAIRADIVLDSAMHTLNQSARFAGAFNSTMWSGFVADRAIAASGLTAYTEAQKRAFAMEFFGHLADNSGKSYQNLPVEIRKMFQRQNFSAADWEAARMADLYKPHPDSAPFLRPADVEAKAGREVALKYSAMMYGERVFAVIEPTLRARSMMTWGTQKGTVPGELLRSATQFKSFGVTVLMLHGGRLLDEISMHGISSRNAVMYGAHLLIVGTLVGAVVVQLKDLIAGRDPRPMDDPTFWGQALLQSGGLGIYGDFLASSGNRFGGGLASTLAGPTAGQIEQFSNLTLGNLKELAQGKNTNAGSELVRFLQGNTPFASTWYTRLAADRLLFEEVQKALDRNAPEAFERRIKQRERDYNGQNFWWSPGQTSPSRAPDATAIILGR